MQETSIFARIRRSKVLLPKVWANNWRFCFRDFSTPFNTLTWGDVAWEGRQRSFLEVSGLGDDVFRFWESIVTKIRREAAHEASPAEMRSVECESFVWKLESRKGNFQQFLVDPLE